MWFSNRRAKWRREEKLRNQRRTPSSSVSSTGGSTNNNNTGNCGIASSVTPNHLTGLTTPSNHSNLANSNGGNTTNNNNNNNTTNSSSDPHSSTINSNNNDSDHIQSGLLSSSNYIHISSLSPPRLNLNNGFGGAMGGMYPSIHPSMQMADSYGYANHSMIVFRE